MLAYELSNIFKVIIFLYHMTTFGLWAAYNAGVKKKKKKSFLNFNLTLLGY